MHNRQIRAWRINTKYIIFLNLSYIPHKLKTIIMKKRLLILIPTTILLMYSCSKNGNTPPLTSITGTWKYVGYSGGIAGLSFQPQEKNSYIQVDTVGNRILFINGDQQDCTIFTAKPCFYCCTTPAVTLVDTVTLNNPVPPGFDSKLLVSVVNDTLIVAPLMINCVDCTPLYYVPTTNHFNWCTDTTVNK